MIKISLCMIVKNEEENLGKTLNSIADFVDEIIVVDTGSTDKSKEIAGRYTDVIYDFKWINDFSAARNFSISKAKNEYVLVLDGDEVVESLDLGRVIELIKLYPKKVGRLLIIDEFTRKDGPYKTVDRLSRLFSKKLFKYEGIIHEQIIPLEDMNIETYDIPLVIKHSGYEGGLEERKKKTQRNLKLLKTALGKKPHDPYLFYQLGKSYYMQEDYKEASDYFGQALYYDLDTSLEYVQDMVESYGYALINSKQYETALQLMNVYDEFAHSADFVFMIGLALMNNGKFQDAINEFYKATKMDKVKTEGVNSYRSFYNMGVIYECLGNVDKAKKYYAMCGDYELAKKRLALL